MNIEYNYLASTKLASHSSQKILFKTLDGEILVNRNIALQSLHIQNLMKYSDSKMFTVQLNYELLPVQRVFDLISLPIAKMLECLNNVQVDLKQALDVLRVSHYFIIPFLTNALLNRIRLMILEPNSLHHLYLLRHLPEILMKDLISNENWSISLFSHFQCQTDDGNSIFRYILGFVKKLELNDLDLFKKLSPCLDLTTLSLGFLHSHNVLTLLEAVVSSPFLSPLQVLMIAPDSQISVTGAQFIAKSTYLQHLLVLNLNANHLGTKGVVILANASNLRHLRRLHLAINDMGPHGMKALCESPFMKNLEFLDVSLNQLGWQGVHHFTHSRSLTHLQNLELSFNDIGNKGAILLSQSENIRHLTVLNLCKNDIGLKGGLALATSPHLTRLQSLTFMLNPLTEEAIIALVQSPYLRQLQLLFLEGEGNILTHRGLFALLESQTLQDDCFISIQCQISHRLVSIATKKSNILKEVVSK